jgi:hypothetical protein
MAKQEKIVVEGEIVTDETVAHSRSYQRYTHKPKDSALVSIWLFGLIAIFFSFIPIFGLALSIIAFIVCLVKKVPPILPIIGIIIGSITTSLFLLLWLVLKAIF